MVSDRGGFQQIMEKHIREILNDLISRYPELESCGDSIAEAYELIRACYDRGGRLLAAGNGGSAADSEHIVGELMKGFEKKRPLDKELKQRIACSMGENGQRLADSLQGALPAVSLTGHPALTTAFGNDVDPDFCFAQQLLGLGRPGDVFLGISTSGNSSNILAAAAVAKAMGITVIGLTGRDGGRLGKAADCAVVVPRSETYLIQELHLPVYHALCRMLEETYFTE